MLEKLKSLKALMSPLSAFFAGTMLTSAAYSLLSSYLAIRLNNAEVPTSYVGIVLSVYYLGYIFATLTAHKIINKVGHIRAFSSYISLLSALILLHIIWFSPLYWGALRLLEGYCMASSFICLESWLNTRSNNQNRGMVMSLYMVTTYIGAALGQLMLNIPDKQNVVSLVLISVLFSVALIPVSLTALPSPDVSKHKQMSIKQLYKIAPVGVVGCIISGILVGNIYTLGAIYAEKAGLSLYHISLFMFFCIFGGMSAQIPIGRLSDIIDRRFIMMWCGSCLFFIAPWIHMFIDGSIMELAGSALLLGAGTFILYPICVSHVNDKIDDEERVEASGLLIMLQSIGMVVGPIVVSYLMQTFGSISFLISFSVANGFFVLFAFKHISFKPDVNYVNVTKTDPMPLNPTHIYSELAKNDSLLDKAANLFIHKNKNEE